MSFQFQAKSCFIWSKSQQTYHGRRLYSSEGSYWEKEFCSNTWLCLQLQEAVAWRSISSSSSRDIEKQKKRQHLRYNRFDTEANKANTAVFLITRYLVVHLFRAIEHIHHDTKGSAQILGSLCLARPCRTGRCTTHGQMKGLGQSDVAPDERTRTKVGFTELS